MKDMETMTRLLREMAECGIIEDFTECPGVRRFDIFLEDNDVVQIEVK